MMMLRFKVLAVSSGKDNAHGRANEHLARGSEACGPPVSVEINAEF